VALGSYSAQILWGERQQGSIFKKEIDDSRENKPENKNVVLLDLELNVCPFLLQTTQK
jgi:hypothetical protein